MTPGERPEIIIMAKLGSAPVAAKLATAVAVGAVVGLLAGGSGFVGYVQAQVYVLLTDRQLMVFEMIRATGGPGKHLASFPRTAVACESAQKGFNTKVRLTVAGLDRPLALVVSPLPPSNKAKALRIAEALTVGI